MIKVFGKPGCQQCRASVKVLKNHDTEFEYVDVTKDTAGAVEVARLGYKSLPVVVTPTEHWFGFRPGKLRQVATAGRKDD